MGEIKSRMRTLQVDFSPFDPPEYYRTMTVKYDPANLAHTRLIGNALRELHQSDYDTGDSECSEESSVTFHAMNVTELQNLYIELDVTEQHMLLRSRSTPPSLQVLYQNMALGIADARRILVRRMKYLQQLDDEAKGNGDGRVEASNDR